ncbi:ADP-ribosylglycohydrolase family protein [Sphaerospermopsis sp. LEGE 08334]|uniref:ADP-ribosylglycohydrolase family protein n=1 Tax=Sphaerospermopsis sp. LEGE 08334 TaxID=1828651 RepID=UPI0018812726|nr:ADP-ribosylglycohydrolase family protein [Sphaerospermopsis sp. LEGE 08334]MBE9056487.1 ADP-ribosylglycohydrolase family protein [Sphaerospermopsis sp. LEGE 08334]
MRYSLVNRVRGIFLGALLGEILATQNVSDLGEIAILGSKSLIKLGKLDGEDWLKCYKQASLDVGDTDHAWGKIILATLPVAIFFHEDPVKLKYNLWQLLQIWDANPVVIDAAFVLGYAIAKSLTETLDPFTLIPETIDFVGESKTSIPQKLLKVNNLLEQGAGLAQAQTEFSKQDKFSNNIALAFYCFLSTLEDFRLTVLRDKNNLREQNSWFCALTGALSGAYNSIEGIPINWQVVLSAFNQPVWGMSSGSVMLELADELVAVWSGAYNISLNIQELTKEGCKINWELVPLSVFAAPRVIRPR